MPYINGYLGKLTKDPDLKQTNSGKQTCNFTIANTKGWGEKKKTEFIPCVAWEKTANTISNYFKKGDNIIVQGEWENNPWQKNEKGYDIPNWKYIVKSIVFLPRQMNNIEEDDDYDSSYATTTQISGVNGNYDVEYKENQFAPISEDLIDLPFDIGLAYP